MSGQAKGVAVVTGASGQLGALLANRLVRDGFTVRVILRAGASHPLLAMDQMQVLRGDFADATVLRGALDGCDTVFHVAGAVSYSRHMDREIYRVNVDGTVALVDAASAAGVRNFVLTSSTMAVGFTGDGAIATEADPFPAELHDIPYADSKRLGEQYVLGASLRGMRAISVCPSTIVGPGEKLGNYRKLFDMAKAGRLRVAPPGGAGIVDVEDVVDGHLLGLERGVSGQRYILSSVNLPFREIFGAINRAVGRDVQPSALPMWPLRLARAGARFATDIGLPMETQYRTLHIGASFRYYDADRARRELGWSPKFTVDDSMKRAAQFFGLSG
jgi:dihydroflavonol-4-reductase